MINRIFLDSSVLIESLKGNKTLFYESLVSNLSNEFFVNDVLVSEYLYYILGFSTENILIDVPKLMSDYNLLSNDAIIRDV